MEQGEKDMQNELGKIEGIFSAYTYPGSISNQVLHMEAQMLRAQRDLERVYELRSAGHQMSNWIYGMSRSEDIPENLRPQMELMVTAWDNAVRKL